METEKTEKDFDLRIEEFRWRKQKFTLVYTSAFTLMFAAIWLGYTTFTGGSLLRDYTSSQMRDVFERTEYRTRELEARIESMQARVTSLESLLKSLEEQQQIQNALIKKLTDKPENQK